uniref:Ctd-like (NLI interacting factor-like) phosphatase n=1 Tax=Pithovirus LCPAC001 TaxID=2506585 RepID=A0A481Z1Y0_9VIRU|nr:MAG: ctd-like (NLI interacting factor-like) phosphatase [Pithovirus LCPAC001]
MVEKTDKCIILDLDETLVHTSEKSLPTGKAGLIKFQQNSSNLYIIDTASLDGNRIVIEKMWGHKRPHLKKFINFCFKRFVHVIIWSAGTDRYVKDIVNRVLCDIKCPHKVYTRKDCFTDEEGILTKPINYLTTNNQDLSRVNLNNTIIIDDRTQNFRFDPNNGVKIPIYNPFNSKDEALLKLMHWCSSEEFSKSKDVRKLNKKNIF